MQIPCKARTTPPRSPDHLSLSIESLVSSVKKYFVRLVEKTETHILVGLLLLLFLLLGLLSGGTSSSWGSTTSSSRWNGSQLAGTLSDQLLDVLALELRDKGGETLIIGLDSNGLEDGLDVGFGWGGATTDGEEKVCCEVLHFA